MTDKPVVPHSDDLRIELGHTHSWTQGGQYQVTKAIATESILPGETTDQFIDRVETIALQALFRGTDRYRSILNNRTQGENK